MRYPDEHQLGEMIEEARAHLDQLDKGLTDGKRPRKFTLAELFRRAKAASRDSVRSARPAGGGGPGSVLDDEGKPMPPVNDPVGELVVQAGAVDPVKLSADRAFTELRTAVGALRGAASALGRAMPRDPDVASYEPGCVVMAGYDHFEPVYRDERCRWVYDWRLLHGEDPPEPIVRARMEGRRITTKLVDEVLGRSRGGARR